MGFSTSGAAAIIFIGLLIAVGIAYPAIEGAHDRRGDAIDDRDERALDIRNTDLTEQSTVYENDVIAIEVQNTGSTTLSVSDTDLLIDGIYQENYNSSVENDGDRQLWQPGETLTMTVSSDSPPDRVKVVTEHGIAVTLTGSDIQVIDDDEEDEG